MARGGGAVVPKTINKTFINATFRNNEIIKKWKIFYPGEENEICLEIYVHLLFRFSET